MPKVTTEFEWIMNHPEHYDGPMHQKAVIGNIEKRHKIDKLEAKVKELEEIVKKQDG